MSAYTTKYSPRNYDDVIGNDKILSMRRTRASNGDFPAATLLGGDTGIGKSSLVAIDAMSIVCSSRHTNGNPCLQCGSCQKLMIGNFRSAGIYRFNGSDVGMEEMREIEQLAHATLLTIRTKVFIIEELQELVSNQKALRYLLGLLDNLPPNVYFIFTAMDISRIDRAILGRAECHYLQRVNARSIVRRLLAICVAEGVPINKTRARALSIIAESSQGSVRDAISKLETCVKSEAWDEIETIVQVRSVSKDTIDAARQLLEGNPCAMSSLQMDAGAIHGLTVLLLQIYKAQIGVQLKPEDSRRVESLKRFSTEVVSDTIENLLNLHPIGSRVHAEFTFLESIRKNKKSGENI